jgi:hypothetical protein
MTSLAELAARAEIQPPPPESGPYSYVHTQGWYLATDQMTDGRILDARVEETERELWVAADGSGRIKETRDSRPSQMSGVYGPGGLYPGPLAATQAGVPAHVAVRQTSSPLPVGWLKDMKSLWLSQTVPPALQADLLRHLAIQRGLRLEQTSDRAGRPGLAVSADDPPSRSGHRSRHALVLDPETGMLLAAEEIAVQRSDLAAGMPDPHSHTSWVRTGYATYLDTRP